MAVETLKWLLNEILDVGVIKQGVLEGRNRDMQLSVLYRLVWFALRKLAGW
jgi:hypothetical protein